LKSATATLSGLDPTPNWVCDWKLVQKQVPDEQVDPAGHYRNMSIGHFGIKNIAVIANLPGV
jgi:hypothetical protein